MKTPIEIINEHFRNVHPNQQSWQRFMKTPAYANGYSWGFSYPNSPNPFSEDSLSWAAWHEGRDQKRANKEFFQRIDRECG